MKIRISPEKINHPPNPQPCQFHDGKIYFPQTLQRALREYLIIKRGRTKKLYRDIGFIRGGNYVPI